ncbi:hypothetical protein B0J14DRAFT_595375 [Halenospora varia]|nr:hypothetical protein B0J14DRAFT_595375 [Halenospora varia]
MSIPHPSGITIQASKVHKRYRSPKQTDGPRKIHKTEIPTFVDPLIVTFNIGPNGSPDQKSFIIHKEVACFHSPVLNAALNSEFIEGQTQTYTLEDTTPGSFRLLMQWLYGGEFKVSQLSADLATMSRGERNQEYEHLLEL